MTPAERKAELEKRRLRKYQLEIDKEKRHSRFNEVLAAWRSTPSSQ